VCVFCSYQLPPAGDSGLRQVHGRSRLCVCMCVCVCVCVCAFVCVCLFSAVTICHNMVSPGYDKYKVAHVCACVCVRAFVCVYVFFCSYQLPPQGVSGLREVYGGSCHYSWLEVGDIYINAHICMYIYINIHLYIYMYIYMSLFLARGRRYLYKCTHMHVYIY